MREVSLSLTAYLVSPTEMKLEPAPHSRGWMDATAEQFAKRCAPMLLANQSGWFVRLGGRFRAMWEGKTNTVKVEPLPSADGRIHPVACLSHFGYGILTFNLPWLFRTPEGWNLLVRGPPNWAKEGIQALEGLVETDWAVETFTMNWKFTTKDDWVTFQEGDPVCFLVPQRRGDLTRFQPEIKPLGADPELSKAYQEWANSRARFLIDLKKPGSEAVKQKWQRGYFLNAKQRKLDLKPFKEEKTASPSPVKDTSEGRNNRFPNQSTRPSPRRRHASPRTMRSAVVQRHGRL